MKKILFRYLGFGVFLYAAFLVVLFVISLLFGFEDSGTGPTLLPALIFAILMCLVAFGMLKIAKPQTDREGFQYSVTWALIAFFLTLFTTVPNGTTQIFFGSWFNWLTYPAIAVAPLLGKIRFPKKSA